MIMWILSEQRCFLAWIEIIGDLKFDFWRVIEKKVNILSRETDDLMIDVKN